MNKNTQWLKLLPAAAVFAAVCVTCYQTDKTPAEATQAISIFARKTFSPS